MSGPAVPAARRGVALVAALLLALTTLVPAVAGAEVDPDAAALPTPTAGPTATPTPDAVAPLPEPAGPETVPGGVPPGPELTAAGAILIDPLDGVILFDREGRVPRRMASTTKIMTVLLGLEALEAGRIPPTLTVTPYAVQVGATPGAARLGLQVGQEVAVTDLLAGLMLRSGNDASALLAEAIAGDEPSFVTLMNARAAELGLDQTHFLDASGLTDDEGHHASPLDLAQLGELAMRHPDFALWAGADALEVGPFGLLENRNELIGLYPGATGVKTGFTTLAGECLVASAERDGRTLYAVVLGSENRVADTTALFDWGFQAFARPVAMAPMDPVATYRWSAAEVPVAAGDELARTVAAGHPLEQRVALDPPVDLPVGAGQALGVGVRVGPDGEVLDRVPLVATAGAQAAPPTAGGALADALRTFARTAPVTTPVQ